MIRIKRAYEPYEKTDGHRILVDRLWPRGLAKMEAHIDEWAKEIAPSTALRQWYHQGSTDLYPAFKKKYQDELKDKTALLEEIRKKAAHHTVTLLYSSKETVYNNAQALKEILG